MAESRDQEQRPCAVWVCGAAASGKSRIAEASILPLGFEMVDVDKWYEELARRHGLNLDRVELDDEDAEHARAGRATRRRAERLFESVASGGWIDPLAFLEALRAVVVEGEIDAQAADRLRGEVWAKIGREPVPSEAFRRALWPRIADCADPIEALGTCVAIIPESVLAVARELARRTIAAGRAARRNLLLLETGGQTGKILKLKNAVEAEGYRTLLVWVAVRTNERARLRNAARRAGGGRGLDNSIIDRTFAITERSRPVLAAAFLPDVVEIDNSAEGEAPLASAIAEVGRRVGRWMEG